MHQALAFRAAVVDLDGTLVDTLGDFGAALDAMLEHLGLPTLPLSTVAGFIGKGSEHLIRESLAAAGASIDSFARLIDGDDAGGGRSVPLLGFVLAGTSGAFDEAGRPSGGGWSEIALPAAEEDRAFALEISGDALAPVYRDGDIVLVSPGALDSVQHRVWDRAYTGVAALTDGLQRLALAMPTGDPHGPFFTPLFAFADRAAEKGKAIEELDSFLRSGKVADRADDDLTLMVARKTS